MLSVATLITVMYRFSYYSRANVALFTKKYELSVSVLSCFSLELSDFFHFLVFDNVFKEKACRHSRAFVLLYIVYRRLTGASAWI